MLAWGYIDRGADPAAIIIAMSGPTDTTLFQGDIDDFAVTVNGIVAPVDTVNSSSGVVVVELLTPCPANAAVKVVFTPGPDTVWQAFAGSAVAQAFAFETIAI